MEGGEIHGWEFKQEEVATPHMRDEGELPTELHNEDKEEINSGLLLEGEKTNMHC